MRCGRSLSGVHDTHRGCPQCSDPMGWLCQRAVSLPGAARWPFRWPRGRQGTGSRMAIGRGRPLTMPPLAYPRLPAARAMHADSSLQKDHHELPGRTSNVWIDALNVRGSCSGQKRKGTGKKNVNFSIKATYGYDYLHGIAIALSLCAAHFAAAGLSGCFRDGG